MINLKTEIAKIIAEIPNPKSYQRRALNIPLVKEALYDYMEQKNITNINEAIYCIANDIEPVQCKCGAKAVFNTYPKGYRKFCGPSCPEKGKHHSAKITEFWENNPEVIGQMLIKQKSTMKDRYGATNPMDVPEFREKQAATMFKNHGVTVPTNSPIILQKMKDTTRKNHGVEYAFQSAEIREKAAHSFEKNHGYKNDMRIPRKAFADANNNMNPFEVEYVKDIIKQTLIQQYGVDHPMKLKEFYAKSRNTLYANYGRHEPSHLHISDDLYEILMDVDKLTALLKSKPVTELAKEFGSTRELFFDFHDKYELDLISKRTRSSYEEEIAAFLDEHNISYVRNYTKLCTPLHVDFYIEEHKLAIEFNGLYWHSINGGGKKTKDYHQVKYHRCEAKKVQLITIFDDEWRESTTIIKNKILHLCGKTSTTIGARKLTIIQSTDKKIIKNFLDTYHLQGKTEGISHAIVAMNGDEIVAVMTLKKTSEGHDMTRYCINNDAVYPGLFTRMISYIRKELPEVNDIVTFADLRWSTGALYENNGFRLVKELDPDYYYTDYLNREHKFNYRKDKLKTKYNIDITGKTELELTTELGLDRVYDCGKRKYKLSATPKRT